MQLILSGSNVDPTYPLYQICAGIGIALITMPAYWQFKCKNVGTITYIIWALVGNINYLVNSIAWKESLHDPPWLWCDVSSAIIVALNVAIPTSSLLITRNLASVSTLRQANISKSRRKVLSELSFGFGIPLLAVICFPIVQGHRFDIVENVGCWPALHPTPMAIPLVIAPPIVINLVSAYYAGLAVRSILKQRKELSKNVVTRTNSGLPFNAYIRLMALSTTEILLSLPFRGYMLFLNLREGVYPWISWEDTHYNFNRVEKFHFGWFTMVPQQLTKMNISRYSLSLGCILFFVFVGLGGESGIFYRTQFWRVAKCLGIPGPAGNLPGVPLIPNPSRVTASSQLQALRPTTAKSNSPVFDAHAASEDIKQNISETDRLPPNLLPDIPYPSKEGWLEAELGVALRGPPPADCRSMV